MFNVAVNDNKTFREIIRAGSLVGLGWGVEFAVLELIADSSTSLKIATAAIGTIAIGAITFESWLQKWRNLFWIVLSILAFTYGCFLVYGVRTALVAQSYQETLHQLYVAGGDILERDVAPKTKDSPEFDETALKQWHSAANIWTASTASWLQGHLGPTARSRFLDMNAMPNQCWTPVGATICFNPVPAQFMNHISVQHSNLSIIIEHFNDYYKR